MLCPLSARAYEELDYIKSFVYGGDLYAAARRRRRPAASIEWRDLQLGRLVSRPLNDSALKDILSIQ
jgi:hypothetical protein